jgi:hypothetical protein
VRSRALNGGSIAAHSAVPDTMLLLLLTADKKERDPTFRKQPKDIAASRWQAKQLHCSMLYRTLSECHSTLLIAPCISNSKQIPASCTCRQGPMHAAVHAFYMHVV